jgi:NAD(P)-dependent dehydrogenase (short-subunit alcohol dehydrogenase family)
MRIVDTSAIVTGAASGLGAATVVALVEQGAACSVSTST